MSENYMQTKLKNKIRSCWKKQFADLKKLKARRDINEFKNDNEVQSRFNHRQLAGLYAVASICYHEGNHFHVIEDTLYDRLC
jgi:hypothetical protein